MKFIADENVARLVISSLRQQGHDVLSIVEEGLTGSDDAAIVTLGLAERRIIVTHDVTTQPLPPDGTSGGSVDKARTVSVASGLDLQSRPSRAG